LNPVDSRARIIISLAQGLESRPTYYHLWNKHSSFHIDYCFVPSSWAKQIAQVDVGGFDDWKGLSDHRPLVVDIDLALGDKIDRLGVEAVEDTVR
jgi:hypothetical protein